MNNNLEKNNDTNTIIYIFGLLVTLSFIGYYFNIIIDINRIKKIETIYNLESFITVNNNELGDRYNLTYGELTWAGMKNISSYCENKGIDKKTFIDLGCGNGKTLAYAINSGFKDARGAEIVQARYDYAMKAREKLDNYMKDKISLSKKDIFELKPEYFPPESVIFISNLMFPEPTNQEMIKHLSKTTPAKTIIILSKLPSNLYDFKLIEQIGVPMSWNPDSKCYILYKAK
jgi:hypothetical protein